MIKGRDVFKLPVVSRDTGEKLGEVKDLIVDERGSRVVGLVTEEKLIGDARVVAWSEVDTVGLDSVIVRSSASVVKSKEVPEIHELLDRGLVLQGTKVQTTAGLELGKIESFYLDRETGRVEGYELSGAATKRPSGRAFLPTPLSFEAGKDYVFVDPSAAETIEDLRDALGSRGG